MASRRRAREPAAEWSCPLCTLLNHWRDRRCAACDQEREPQYTADDDVNGHGDDEAEQQPQQLVKRETAQAASSGAVAPVIATPLTPVRTLRGVFFSSATAIATTTATTQGASNWREEPRLKVNRRKQPLALKSPAEAIKQDTGGSFGESQSTESQAPNFSLLSSFGAATPSDVAYACADIYPADSRNEQVVQQEQPVPLPPSDLQRFVQSPQYPVAIPPQFDEPPADHSMMLDEEEESQPCFQLLGPNTVMFSAEATVAATPVDEPEHLPYAVNNNNSSSVRDPLYRDMTTVTEYIPPNFNVIDVSSPPARLPPHNAERQRRTVEPIAPAVPKSVLQQGFVAASRVPLAVEGDNVVEAKLAQAGLDLSDSDSDENNSRRLPRNKLRRNRIASPEPAEEEEEKKAPAVESNGGTWECPVCTNFNSCALIRCELCETKREDGMNSAQTSNNNDSNDNDSDQYIDLAMSQEEEAKAAAGAGDAPNYYGFDPRDFENPYEQIPPDFPAYDEYGGADMGGAGYDDYVEDISDNEAPMMAYSGSPTVRADLKEFEHFVCVEDLASDYGCRIDYRQMFGESKRGKVYADRIQTRRRASQKRKRAQDANGGEPPARAPKKKKGSAAGSAGGGGAGKPPYGRQKAAAYRREQAAAGKARGAKKRKSAVASGAAAAAGRGKTASRRASAPATGTYSGINHYDTSGADFGDGVNTMAWEGVGSAGYF